MLGPKRAFTLVFSETGVKCQLLSTVTEELPVLSGGLCFQQLVFEPSLTELSWKMSWRQVLQIHHFDEPQAALTLVIFFYVIITEPGK